jgi:ribosomal protein L7Ae-like RNA K-turn-binding protein
MIKDAERIYTFLGFAQKAGKLVSGENTVEARAKERSAKLILVAEDAPDHTKERMASLANRYHLQYTEFGEKNRIGQSIGKSPRNVVLISDKELAVQILQ